MKDKQSFLDLGIVMMMKVIVMIMMMMIMVVIISTMIVMMTMIAMMMMMMMMMKLRSCLYLSLWCFISGGCFLDREGGVSVPTQDQ